MRRGIRVLEEKEAATFLSNGTSLDGDWETDKEIEPSLAASEMNSMGLFKLGLVVWSKNEYTTHGMPDVATSSPEGHTGFANACQLSNDTKYCTILHSPDGPFSTAVILRRRDRQDLCRALLSLRIGDVFHAKQDSSQTVVQLVLL